MRRLAAWPLRTTHRSAVPNVRFRRFRPKLFYSKLPDDIASSFVFLLDPMIAERILLSSAPCPIHSITVATMRVCAGGGRSARRTEHERSTTLTGVPVAVHAQHAFRTA